MPCFLVPAAPGADRGIEIKTSVGGAELMQLARLQAEFNAEHPKAFCRRRYVFGRRAGRSLKAYRLQLEERNARGTRLMPRFTLEPVATTATLLVLARFWSRAEVPWFRILNADGGSDLLPDFTWNDAMGAQDLESRTHRARLSSPITTPAA